MNGNAQHIALAHLVGLASFVVPDEAVSFAGKVIAAIILGLVTGFMSKIGTMLAAKVGAKGDKGDKGDHG